PHHQEEAHHRGHEIREGDLPDAAMRPFLVVVAAAAHDDDLAPAVLAFRPVHASTSASAADHSPIRVSNRLLSSATTRSMPSASLNSTRSANRPRAGLSAS